jgi:hypothetical protein
MRIPRSLPLLCLALPLLAGGCHSSHSAKQRHRVNSGSFADQSARSAYVSQRVDELTKTGMTREDAAARASREWFSRAPSSGTSVTAEERKRREAQANFEDYLNKRDKDRASR